VKKIGDMEKFDNLKRTELARIYASSSMKTLFPHGLKKKKIE
jgi:hypothetical protein